MAFDFQGKNIVVTGGASGIGLGLAKALARRGAGVGIADVEGDKAKAIAAELTSDGFDAHGFCVDVRLWDSVEALANDSWNVFGRVDGIFNNAGIGAGRPFLKSREEDFDWTFGVNTKGVWLGSRIFGERFVQQDTPSLIVNTGSEHSLGVPHLNNGVYTGSKHAVLGMTDVLRREMPDHVQVSCFCPGLVNTAIYDAARNRPAEYGGSKEAAPMGRLVMEKGMSPDDIAARVLDSVETGAFYVVTHPHNMKMIEARFAEVSAAYEAQTADVDGFGYDVNDVMAAVMREQAEK